MKPSNMKINLSKYSEASRRLLSNLVDGNSRNSIPESSRYSLIDRSVGILHSR